MTNRSVRAVWALEMDDGSGRLVCPAIDDDGTDSFLAFPSKRQALQGADFQLNTYGIACTPVQLRGGGK